MDMLYVASGTLAIFFILLLLSKPEKGLADKILAGWFGLILTGIAASYIVSKELPGKFYWLEVADAVSFLHGPSLWFYTLALTRNVYRFQKQDALHLLPFVLSVLFFLVPVLLDLPIPEGQRNLAVLLKFLLILGYAMACLFQLQRYNRELPEFLSNPEKYQLRWLGLIIGGILVIWLVGSVSLLLYLVVGLEIPDYGGLYTNTAVSLFTLVLGFFGFRHTPIFIPGHFLHSPSAAPVETPSGAAEPPKYFKSGLDPATAETYARDLKIYMSRHKPYLDRQLTLFELAEALTVSPNHLSQVINTYYQQNFFEFINAYRVEEVKKKILAKDHHQHTLLGIALDCGFYSKASFNRAFRKFTGMTPSEFAKEEE